MYKVTLLYYWHIGFENMTLRRLDTVMSTFFIVFLEKEEILINWIVILGDSAKLLNHETHCITKSRLDNRYVWRIRRYEMDFKQI